MLLTTNGNIFDISGTVADNGSVTGGFAVAGPKRRQFFTGTFTTDTGGGTWTDDFGCQGNWEALLQGG